MSKIKTTFRFKENKAAKAAIRRGVNAGLTAVGIDIEYEAIKNLDAKVYNGEPRDYVLTGDLKQKLFYDVKMNRFFGRVTVGDTMEYAPYVEYPGISRNYAGKPFLRPAFDKVKVTAKAIIAKFIKANI